MLLPTILPYLPKFANLSDVTSHVLIRGADLPHSPVGHKVFRLARPAKDRQESLGQGCAYNDVQLSIVDHHLGDISAKRMLGYSA